MSFSRTLIAFVVILLVRVADAQDSTAPHPWIGYTELQTNLPGGRHANVRTMRATLVKADGTGCRRIAEELVDDPNSWTQFVGWSPDGKLAIVARGWQDPTNAAWEEEHKTFRMEPGKWKLDSCLVDLDTGKVTNLTAVDRVSDYNGGLFFMPDGKTLGFTALIGTISKPFVMDLDGHNKKDVSGDGSGFAYGYSASPDGRLISYHENYQIYIANADGTGKKHITTGHNFNFGPTWSSDAQTLMFLSGEHYHSNPYLVNRDGSQLRKLVDLNGYRSHTLFLDVPDFHEGSSDLPVWAADGRSVFYSALVGATTELYQVTLAGEVTQLTHSKEGTLHYHIEPSADGKKLLYGKKQDGVRQLNVMDLADRNETRITDLHAGQGAMWAHWQRSKTP